MRNYIRCVIYLVVSIGFSVANSGSYDDFFNAIQHDEARVLRGLLGRGFDPNTVNQKGEHGLILALRANSLQVVDALIDSPLTQIEVRTAQDESPLMLAALRGHLDICKRLIVRDADVNKPGWAPLHYAATGAHIAIIRLLIDNHAYIDAAAPNGTTPLMMAAKYGTDEAVKVLLTAGADPALKNMLGLSAIDFALQVQRDDIVQIIAAAVRAQRPKGIW